ncbi:MAG: hypothetical protein WBB36_10925, partial [Chitinophagales bacterium]
MKQFCNSFFKQSYFPGYLNVSGLLIALLFLTPAAAQVLDLPSAVNFVKAGDVDVSGNQITVEA